ncbi:Site-specific recombinase XerD [Hartmannibacter diazotrophicus]|uniref:Site-specific recombinase XerD n=1 Tax=Hartmannibacter diazotrophicus TaxID=1482074 RepID=A0A2C9D1Y9_9HYPH|nr:DUF6538 domain-containing protein [Hartmannibacter diazotrophicus]SON54342.1 Site-specific recombinase XerD [Hartmannibacter diazotrophicus]
MAKNDAHLLRRGNRYWARLVIPEPLRSKFGNKRELRKPLGPDLVVARKRLHEALAEFHAQIDKARNEISGGGTPAASSKPQGKPLLPHELAALHYQELIKFDEDVRNSGHPLAAIGLVDDILIHDLRAIKSGTADDKSIVEAIGSYLDDFRRRGHLVADEGSPPWRQAARAIAAGQYEALARVMERDEGNFAGKPADPELERPIAAAKAEPTKHHASLFDLLADYVRELQFSNRGHEAEKRWRPIFRQLVDFLGHDDASRLTRDDIIAWKDDLLTKRSPKTVRDSCLASLKAVLGWAVDNGRLPDNPAVSVKVRMPKPELSREPGYNEREAQLVLTAALNYAPRPFGANGIIRERPHLTAAKRWIPWLCAFTGARVAELCQLRKGDIRVEQGIAYLRISPDAGSVKNGQFRDVPIHKQLLEIGFFGFVESCKEGPLFYSPEGHNGQSHPAKQTARKIAQWIRSLGILDSSVDPNHGFRHRFKTLSRGLGVDPTIADAIQGHTGRTASDKYGRVPLVAKANAIEGFPFIEILGSSLDNEAVAEAHDIDITAVSATPAAS